MAVLDERRAIADAGQLQQLRVWKRAGSDNHLAPRAICFVSLPWRYSTPTARLPSNRMAGRMRAGSRPADWRGYSCGGVDIGPRAAAAALAVLLRHLGKCRGPSVLVGVEILTQRKLSFLRRLQEILLHRIVGAQFV